MGSLWHKVWYDLWQSKSRTGLAILSITAGVFSIGAIFGLIDQLVSGMDEAHRAVNPAHVSLFLDAPIDQRTAESLLDVSGVSQVEPLNRLGIRYKTDPDGDWQEGSLTMRQDFDDQQIDLVELKAGDWPNNLTIGVERLTSQFFDIGIGDAVIFQLPGTDRTFEVVGMVRHPFVEPPPFGGEAHFFVDAQTVARIGIPEGFFASLMVQIEPYSRENAEEIAGELRSRLGDQGFNVAVTLFQEPDRHWGRDFVDGLMVVLRVMAVVSLLLSVVLVTNTLTALISQQTDQIGIIKAIGGSNRLIAQTYFAGVILFGGLSLFIALPLGALVAFYGSGWFLNLFNIDHDIFVFSRQALIWQLLAATAVPILAALWPVLKGANITVREAISSYGLGSDFGSNWVDQKIELLAARYFSAALATSLGNMFRRKGRLLLTQLVLVVAGVMFLTVMTLVTSTNRTLDNEMARRGYDLRLGFVADQRLEQVAALALSQPEVTAVEGWLSRSAIILRDGEKVRDAAGLGAQLTGVPEESQMLRPLIINGRWLQPGDDRVVVISDDSAEENNIQLGDVIGLDLGPGGSADWTVIGTYKMVTGADFVTESIFAPLPAVVDVTNDVNRTNMLYLQTRNDSLESTTAVSEALRNQFEARSMDVSLLNTEVKPQERANILTQFAPVVGMLLSLAMLMATVGGLGLMGALGISVVERTREIGVMRAIGASSETMMRMFVIEGVLQGVLSWLISIPLAMLASQPLAQLLGQTMLGISLDFAFDYGALLLWLLIILIIATLASIIPARTAMRISVRQSLAYG